MCEGERDEKVFTDDALVAFRDTSQSQSECLPLQMKLEASVGKAKSASLCGWHTDYIALCWPAWFI